MDHFIADTHFSHKGIIRHCGRPFASAEEMDEALVDNWNRAVAKGDTVYHLGDFCCHAKPEPYLRRLNGAVCMIEGNHDDFTAVQKAMFRWYDKTKMIRIDTMRQVFLSHYAHRVWDNSFYDSWHLYGHSHNMLPDDPDLMSFEVSVDAIAARLSGLPSGMTPAPGQVPKENYRPLSWTEVKEIMTAKHNARFERWEADSAARQAANDILLRI